MKDWLMNKLYLKVIGAAAAIALSITGYIIVEGQSYKPIELIQNDSAAASAQKPGSSAVKKEEPPPKTLMVQISGCVKAPGIYTMLEGQRVLDAIDLAGGASMEIDDRSINLAAKVKDGQKIYFQPRKIDNPGMSEASAIPAAQGSVSGAGEKAARQAAEKININTASSAELQRLPGIGEYYARKIIDFRTANGPFPDTGSIVKVSGIGAARFEQIKAYITVK